MSDRPETPALSRRDLLASLLNLAWLLPLGAGIAALLRFMRFDPPEQDATQFALGRLSDLPVLPAYMEHGMVWLESDGAGLYAVDAVCTHLGCIVRIDDPPVDGFHCDCHGSRFAADGAVTNGPAARPLRFLRLYWTPDNQLAVDRAAEVGPDFRLGAG